MGMTYHPPYDDIRNWDLNAARVRRNFWTTRLERASTLRQIAEALNGLDRAKDDVYRLESQRKRWNDRPRGKRGRGNEQLYWKTPE